MLKRILAITQIVFLDGIRRYALLGLLIFGLCAEMGGLLFADFIGRDLGRAVSDYSFSVLWLAGLAFLFFHAVHIIAWDDDKKFIYSLLSRPISRPEYILGVFLGLSVLLFLLLILLAITAWIALSILHGMVETVYFPHLSPIAFIQSFCGLCLMLWCILAVICLLSSVLRGHFVVTIVALAYYIICSTLPVIRSITANQGENNSTLFQLLTFIFPDYARLDFKDAIVGNTTLSSVTSIGDFAIAIAYLLMVITLTCLIYQKRDIY